MSEEKTVTLYVAGSCGPCADVRAALKAGKVNGPKVKKVVDLEQPVNLHFIEDLGLSRVPTAMRGKMECQLGFDGDTLVIECPEEKEDGV